MGSYFLAKYYKLRAHAHGRGLFPEPVWHLQYEGRVFYMKLYSHCALLNRFHWTLCVQKYCPSKYCSIIMESDGAYYNFVSVKFIQKPTEKTVCLQMKWEVYEGTVRGSCTSVLALLQVCINGAIMWPCALALWRCFLLDGISERKKKCTIFHLRPQYSAIHPLEAFISEKNVSVQEAPYCTRCVYGFVVWCCKDYNCLCTPSMYEALSCFPSNNYQNTYRNIRF